jgi:transposase
MRYELSDHEWTAIKPMLPNKLCGIRRVNDRRVLKAYRYRSPGTGVSVPSLTGGRQSG